MRKKTYLKLVQYQTEQAKQHLNEVRSIHSEMRGYKHDFHHHLQALKGQLIRSRRGRTCNCLYREIRSSIDEC